MYVIFNKIHTFTSKGGEVMLFSYRNCIAKFGTDYGIKKEIQKQKKKNEKILAKIDSNYKSVLKENGRKLPTLFFKELSIEN